MTRRWISRINVSNRKRGRNENENSSHLEIPYSGPSFSDLSKDILINIFLRLFLKSIFVCKSVCKTWRDLISDPEFAKLHFLENQEFPLIHAIDSISQSEMLYLVQPEKDDLELKLNMCDHTYSDPSCVCNASFTLDTRFYLPSPHVDMVIGNKYGGYNLRRHYCGANKNRYSVVNSCNGLLCLSSRADNRSTIICNPVTSEFIELPYAKKVSLRSDIRYGFGFSFVSNKYKVVRVINCGCFHKNGIWVNRVTIEVHIVGKKSWSRIEHKLPYFMYGCPTYLNGFLYWLHASNPLFLISFDVENESFGSDLGPAVHQSNMYKTVGVGVLGDELCISALEEPGTFHVWAMKDKIWSKFFAFDLSCIIRHCNSLKPLKYFKDGSLLMLYCHKNSLVHFDPKKSTFRFSKIRGKESRVEALVAHIPSIVSLKHSLSGHNVKVHYMRPRCRELKLEKRVCDLQIGEEEFVYYQQIHHSSYS